MGEIHGNLRQFDCLGIKVFEIYGRGKPWNLLIIRYFLNIFFQIFKMIGRGQPMLAFISKIVEANSD